VTFKSYLIFKLFLKLGRRENFFVLVGWFGNHSYRGAEKSLARPTSRCILFDGENIAFDASLVIYIYIYRPIYIVLIFLKL
jgi:hypothetical protein